MLKANSTMARNGSGSSAEKIEPTHNQTSGAPIQKKWCPVPMMPVISAMAIITYSHFSTTSRSTPVILISTNASIEPMISSHTPSTHRCTTHHQ
ncbi:hypothetical protein D3C72_1519360 [compost metagenome]